MTNAPGEQGEKASIDIFTRETQAPRFILDGRNAISDNVRMDAERLPNYTPDQHAAIKTWDVSVALSAGAGCGKTFVLTQRFLSHLKPGLHSASLEELVAITFTDRAAREMRDRIRGACRQQLQTCPAEEVSHWLKILYDLDAARITTIHSFCTSLLRSHAVEAGLDPRFTVADAAQTDALISRSARDTLHRLLEQQHEDALFSVLHFGLERAETLLAGMIGQRFRATADSLALLTAESLAESWPRVWQAECVSNWMKEFLHHEICQHTYDWLSEHTPKPKTVMFTRRETILALLTAPPETGLDPTEWLRQLRAAAMFRDSGGKAAWHDPDDAEQIKDFFAALRDEIDSVLNRVEFNSSDVAFAAEVTARVSRLGIAAIEDYRKQKAREGRLDFDDLLLLARNLLCDTPAVARRLASGIRLLMVDEFQDTDPVQSDIIRAIAGPALKTGKLFLVGDAKQSIYRFRRADPQVFAELRAEIPPNGQIPLKVNFRSQPEILNFVYHLFAGVWGPEAELIPFPDEQKSPPPTIEFLWATRDLQPSADPSGKVSADELRTREASWIAARISQLLADTRPTVRDSQAPGGLRPVQRRDIAILFRTLSNAATYEAALAELGIDYYLVGGKTFFAQQEVFDLLNLCRWLDDPADEIPLVGILRSPFFNCSDDAIFSLKLVHRSLCVALAEPPAEWLPESDRQRIRFAARVLSELREQKDRLPPSELIKTAIEWTGYDGALLHEYLGSRKVANLDKLIRRAGEFDDAEHFTLSDYVRELEQAVDDQTDESLAATLPEAEDVVRLMTIHQSKGLEFPVVIVADMNRQSPSRSSGIVWHPKWGALVKPPDEFGVERQHLGLKIHQAKEEPAEADEKTRLLYVATTRAKDRLILSAGMSPERKAESPWLKLLDERFHLETGFLKGDPFFGSLGPAQADPKRVPQVFVHHDPPTAVPQRKPEAQPVPLKKLTETVLSAEAEAFPETVNRYQPSTEWRGMLSVSALEQLMPDTGPTWFVPDAEPSVDDVLPRAAADLVGTVVHGVLQVLDFRQAAAWPAILSDVIRRAGLTSNDEAAVRADVGPLLENLLSSPLAATFAQAETLQRETDFVLSWPLDAAKPRALLTGQIDMLLKNDLGWHLYDYKTGRFPAKIPDAELLSPYTLQLGLYALAAEKILQQPLTSIGLIVLRPQVRVLSYSWSAAERQHLVKTVDRVLDETQTGSA